MNCLMYDNEYNGNDVNDSNPIPFGTICAVDASTNGSFHDDESVLMDTVHLIDDIMESEDQNLIPLGSLPILQKTSMKLHFNLMKSQLTRRAWM